jgi:ubiquinone/menaquinone biosynthesis C-methylase UbiE
MSSMDKAEMRDTKELALLYDLYIVPVWREFFDSMVDEEIELPKEGKFLDAGCGTGGYTIDLAIRAGEKTEVIGVDPSPERLALARGKAEIKKLDRVNFQTGDVTALELPGGSFDLVIGDATMLRADQIGTVIVELTRVAKQGAMIILKLATRGSFDEFFSIHWESLYNLDLTQYTPQLESLITERLTVSNAEQLAIDAGLEQVRSVTRKDRFDYPDAKAFFESPLIDTYFVNDWLGMFPEHETRQRVQNEMMEIIDRERHGMDFDVSVKATLIIGQKT